MLLQLTLCAGLVVGGCATALAADAPSHLGRGKTADGIVGEVTAESRYGTATVSGPVRRGGHDRLEVRLPGGTWIECGRSCSETLRHQTVDFWQNFGGSGRGDAASNNDGPGYLILRRP